MPSWRDEKTPISPNLWETPVIKSSVLPVALMEGSLDRMAGKTVLAAGNLGVFDALERGLKSVG